jgi:hypothetical protein
LRNPEATCCLDEETKYAISCSTRERRKKTNSNSKIKRKIVEKQKKGKRERERDGGGREIPETGSEKCTGIKKTMKSQSEKKDKKGRTKKKRKKKVPNSVVNFFLLLYQPAVGASYSICNPNFSFMGGGLQKSK